ncbi:MAG: MBL fold metallo-hydrolase [Acidobacteria bacterium]|nr:MBL fold metallo-hydrolase [Acidobacteriota bacterium]
MAVLAIFLVVAAAVGLYFFKPWWEKRRAEQPPPASGEELRVVVMDVGHGDSILIVAPGGKTVLVDAGMPGTGKKILDALKRNGVDHLDYFVATHAHADHIGAADEVFKVLPVGAVLSNGMSNPPDSPKPTKEYATYLKALGDKQLKQETVTPGQTIELGGGASLRVLAPLQPPVVKEEVLRAGGNEPNANSVVMRLVYGGFSMLLAGDAETITEDRIIRGSANVSADVLKVAHHGSKYATSDELLKRGAYKAAIISVGLDNRYGQPGQDTLNRLKAANLRLYRTDFQGEITITTKGKEGDFKITPAREPKANEDVWAGRQPLRDDSARRGFLDFGDLPPVPKPTPEKAKGKASGNK